MYLQPKDETSDVKERRRDDASRCDIYVILHGASKLFSTQVKVS